VRIRAILNPRAGVAAQRAQKAIRLGGPTWQGIETRLTTMPGQARDLARDAAEHGFDLVLAVGGDGTVNEVASGLLGFNVPLGIVPAGSGNGLARALRIPLCPYRAVQTLESGVEKLMDVGLANGRPFLNVTGAGFDAAVGAAFHAQAKNGGRRGLLKYVRLSLAQLPYRALSWNLSAAGQHFEGRAVLVAFVNGRQYGGGAVIAPRARFDDGQLDVIVLEEAHSLELLLNAPRLFLGNIEGFRCYRHFRTRAGTLRGTGPIQHHRDGEPEEAVETLNVEVRPRALNLLVPRSTAEDPDGPFLPEGDSGQGGAAGAIEDEVP